MSTFDALLAAAAARPLTGWDLSYDGRITSEEPWNFTAIVTGFANESPDLLDMGTGGGEWLSRLPHRPPRTVATEGWPLNVPVARARLAPLGIEVVPVAGAPDNVDQAPGQAGGALPFPDASFHLVVSRHESYLAREVHRVLAPGGWFVTQQVASGAGDDLYRLLFEQEPTPPARAWTLSFATDQLEAAGFTVEASAASEETISFADVGALVWYAANLPWQLPSFEAADRRDRLRELHDRIEQSGPIRTRMPLFWLAARRP